MRPSRRHNLPMNSHPDYLPTGNPVVGKRRSYGERPEAERIGVGVLGLHEGHTMLIALRASGLCRAVAGCDSNKDKLIAAGHANPGLFTTPDYDLMLARPEVKIVAIYTPDYVHADHIERAMRAGKHVLCTKPLINDLADAERLRAVAKDTCMRLQVAQSTRFGESFIRQREQFEAGDLGEVEVVDAFYNHRMDWYYRKSPWSIDQTHWAFLGLSHPIDLVRWYLGPIRDVQAFGTITELGRQHGLETPDAITVNLIGESGRLGRVLGNFGITEMPRSRSMIECHLMGSKGSSLARYPDLRFSSVAKDGIEREEDFDHSMAGYYYRHELKGMHYGEFTNCVDYFAAKILAEEPNSPDLEEGLNLVGILNRVVEALK